MSLHRILNNDGQGSPGLPANHASSPQPVIDPALQELARASSPRDQPAPRRSTRHQQQQPAASASVSPSALSQPMSHVQYMSSTGYQPSVGYPAPSQGGWDVYNGEWVQFPPPPPSGTGNHPPYFVNGNGHVPPDVVAELLDGDDSDGSPEMSGRGRKRKANDDDDADYNPRGSRRNGPRRYPPRTRTNHRTSAAEDGEGDLDESVVDEGPSMNEEDIRLVSSDLDDCQEIWLSEVSDYILETRKRHREVEAFYKLTVIERDRNAAIALAHRYNQILKRMPPPLPPLPPTPPPPVTRGLGVGSHSPAPDPLADPFDNIGAEHAAQEFEDSVLGPTSRQLTTSEFMIGGRKRPVDSAISDASTDVDVSSVSKRKGKEPANKKRKTGESASAVQAIRNPAPKGKGKSKQTREQSPDSVATGSGGKRKRPAARKKLDALPPQTQELLGIGSSASVAEDITPSPSRPASPALTAVSDRIGATVFELDEDIPPLRKAKKVDDTTMLKRIRTLEEAQKKVWTTIAKRDVPRAYKFQSAGYQARQAQLKRIATLSSMQARKPFTRTPKITKDIQVKGKRLMREMLVFWKKNEKEERDVRKREQKEASDRAKVEEEKREAARQARKLEFLISQTELYSHFVGNKLKTSEVEGDEEGSSMVPAGADLADVDPNTLEDINFDDEDQTNLHLHARRNAQEAIVLAKMRAQDFDTQASLERKANEVMKLTKAQAHIRDDSELVEVATGHSTAPLVDLDSDELNFQNPTSLSGLLSIKQPQMLMAQLKEYQLKGLNWLATLYEQGINGILADEMGLGKTVQSISLLAHLAETYDIWGPFLVVAPASTLHNWQQELTRFVPNLKALPYWGNPKDRATLRKFWSKKEISYDKDAPFHVLITSYQLVTQDQQYFQRVKWQYMILDEAQNIKNAASVRWKTLLGFHCRNRLLLTGTPIQNSMQELWALLHFIMPSLFDSHDEFNEWFSKDIENAAENKGSRLSEYQLRRLHMILKPFMLRRVKRHVQNELSEKIERDVYVDLSARQRSLYRVLAANVSVADLLAKAANIGDAESARSLMNLVMQFRKVCNHPELFERADVRAPFSFSRFGQVVQSSREIEPLELRYSNWNPIEYQIPELLYHDGGFLDVPREDSFVRADSDCLTKLMNIWSIDWIQRSLYEEHSGFSFLRFIDKTPSDVHKIYVCPLLRRRLMAVSEEMELADFEPFSLDESFAAHSGSNLRRIITAPSLLQLHVADGQPELREISKSAWAASCLSRPGFKWFIPPAVAPVISMYCKSRTFLEHQAQLLEGPLESLALFGLPQDLQDSPEAYAQYDARLFGLSPRGLVGQSGVDQLPLSTMQVPEAKRLIYDSGKLACLDALLHELKAGDHRVLIYFQMTRMMDLMEEYLIYRQFKYLRLDGSSKLEDRRDMVMEWQTRPDIFIFLLSTRAGGLGINLTAADTVVFYDHDWNPSNDAQAMDRAHRLGQTRQVTVYRLITRGTIDERIVQLARVKKDVQDIVVGNKNFTDVTKPSEIVQLLLNEEQLANLGTADAVPSQSLSGQPVTNGSSESMRELWNEEGDDFFAGKNPSRGTPEAMDETGEIGVAVTTKKRTKSSNKARTKPVGGNAGKGSGRASKPKQSAAAVAQAVTAAT